MSEKYSHLRLEHTKEEEGPADDLDLLQGAWNDPRGQKMNPMTVKQEDDNRTMRLDGLERLDTEV